jgi:DNA modification methylase
VPDLIKSANKPLNGDANKLLIEDQAAHNWYRFVLSYPPHLVRHILERFDLRPGQRVLDPFCGTGTTLVECQKMGIDSTGMDAHPMAYFASQVKTNWRIDADAFTACAERVADEALAQLERDGIIDDPIFKTLQHEDMIRPGVLRTLDAETEKLLLANSISPLPLHKVLVLRDCLNRYHNNPSYAHQLLALANVLTFSISNLHFGPEVGVGRPKQDAPVVAVWLDQIRQMARDVRALRGDAGTEAIVHHADARNLGGLIAPASIDAVITSPPYPNEKDYTRTTRLESVLLGFVNSKSELQTLKRGLLRSNTRGVYKGDDDDAWVDQFPEIQRIADLIESRRIELGKTSGFERLYARVTRLYFGGMARHLANLRPILKPGARLGYVVGDQASYLRVLIRTGEILGSIAESLGYEVIGLELFRTRLATATKAQLREEVLLLRWPG